MQMTSKKKVLIITYYWPPSGGSGVQRWVKFVKYLDRLGWEPIIYTPENPEYPSLDDSMLKDLPANLTVLKQKIWEPFDLYKRFTRKKKGERLDAGFLSEDGGKEKWSQKLSVWIRGNFFIPDARKFWIKPSIRFLDDYLKKNPVDYLVSTGPPHSMHLIAKALKRKHTLKWIADFRDPWTNIDFYKDLRLTKWADKKHRRLEKSVLTQADVCITIGNTMKLEFEELGGKKVKVITNGFDEEDLPIIEVAKDELFSIAHIGVLNPSRNPYILWKALSELVEENEDFAKRLQLKLVGKVDFSVKEDLRKLNLIPYLNYIPYLNHDEAILEQKKSHLLLLLVNNTPNSKGILTGKLFEYLSVKTPILGIGPMDGDAAIVLNESKAGKMVDYDDLAGMKKYLLDQCFNAEALPETDIFKYSRRELTNQLVKFMEEA
jgi:glycosyltransferase involved in cell wall biosynthesis